jgi:PTS system cellobiose-specific IIB component
MACRFRGSGNLPIGNGILISRILESEKLAPPMNERAKRTNARRRAMERVLVVCGAGASSTFLAHWMRQGASSRGLEITVQAGSLADLPAQLPDLDILLVGAHLRESYPRILEQAAGTNVRVALLPALTYDRVGSDLALGIVEELTDARPG